MLLTFRAAILLNALLLFLVQPMFARMALPLLGGSPAVWTTCMLFFQAALLVGYLYAHASLRALGIRRQIILHVLFLAAPMALLPIGIAQDLRPAAISAPTGWLLWVMVGSIGLPFVLLSTTAPLLQRWFSVAASKHTENPYALYASSNVGSLAGLLLYPTVIEPVLPLRIQQVWWSTGYVAVALLIVACGVLTYRASSPSHGLAVFAREVSSISNRLRLRWLILAAVPSGLMLAVTQYISTDIAAVPLLWIVPLALYLSTFIIAFGSSAAVVASYAKILLPLVLLPLVLFLTAGVTAQLWFIIPLHLIAFWLLALLCHDQLSKSRPDPSRLTEFYVWLAAGGMLGGIFNTFLAPKLFIGIGEYPLLIGAACLAIAKPPTFKDLFVRRRLLVVPSLAALNAAIVVFVAAEYVGLPVLLPLLAVSIILCFSVSRHMASFALGISAMLFVGLLAGDRTWGDVLHAERTFFGVYRIVRGDGGLVSLIHGTTLHGSQKANPIDAQPEPLTYYHRRSPIADVFAAATEHAISSVGVVGLGVGSLAAYAQPNQSWTFYEIDPSVERIAKDERYFTYLKACAAACRVAIGDGRLLIAAEPKKHDILVLDAFSSDAIPVHLLTTEALDEYLGHLSEGGVLAFHISNRHFDLRPVLGRAAANRNLLALMRFDSMPDAAPGLSGSLWVVMARTPEVLAQLAANPDWKRMISDGRRAWTDDFSNIWASLNPK